MKTKECPACAMEVDANSRVCPICAYEFTGTHQGNMKWIAILLVILFIIYLIFL